MRFSKEYCIVFFFGMQYSNRLSGGINHIVNYKADYCHIIGSPLHFVHNYAIIIYKERSCMICLKSDRSQTCATLTRFPSQAYAAIREAKQEVESGGELIDARFCHIAQIGNKNFVDYPPLFCEIASSRVIDKRQLL